MAAIAGAFVLFRPWVTDLSNCFGGGIFAIIPSLVRAKVKSPANRPSRVVISITGPFRPDLSFRSFRATWPRASLVSSRSGDFLGGWSAAILEAR